MGNFLTRKLGQNLSGKSGNATAMCDAIRTAHPEIAGDAKEFFFFFFFSLAM